MWFPFNDDGKPGEEASLWMGKFGLFKLVISRYRLPHRPKIVRTHLLITLLKSWEVSKIKKYVA